MFDAKRLARIAQVSAYGTHGLLLNMLTVQLAFELHETRIKVNSADPGSTATDLNQHRGQTVAQGATEAVRLALLPEDGPTGGFFSSAGRDPGEYTRTWITFMWCAKLSLQCVQAQKFIWPLLTPPVKTRLLYAYHACCTNIPEKCWRCPEKRISHRIVTRIAKAIPAGFKNR